MVPEPGAAHLKQHHHPLVTLLVPKMAQEYLLHVAEAQPWDWTKKNILQPIGINI